MAVKMRLLIDTDVGVDDAGALILALSRHDVEIEGITAVRGNASVDNVCKNIRKVLRLCDKPSVPVYRGCSEPLICDGRPTFVPYHGVDGLGDIEDDDVVSDDVIQSQHAVTYLLEVVAKYPKQLTLVCLGPLTNIAIALKIDPTFGVNLKECFLMGGNYQGVGNITMSAEFNFYADPEAAHIALLGLRCPITVTGWEVCLNHGISYREYERIFEGEGRARKFIRVREATGLDWLKSTSHEYVFADQLAMAVTLDRAVVKSSFRAIATVELHGGLTRGQMVVKRSTDLANVTVIENLHKSQVIDMLITALDKFD